jgi:RNA polymerase sigma-70 factor (ECF subfamily)
MESALHYLENKERTAIINKALYKLKEEDRVLLTLFYFEEISIKEISKIMDLTDDNVKVKLFRSRKKLANILKNVIEPNTINLV